MATTFISPTPNASYAIVVDEKKNGIVEDVETLKPVVATDYSGATAKTDPKEIALVKKLDWRIMPMLWAMYWLNYLDRNAIALARIDHLERDLKLSSSQYLTCVSILFVGYILGTIPSNLLLTRCRPSWYLGGCMILWAIVSGLTALSTNFTGLLLTRFFLGITESPYYPGAVYMLSTFYTRKEVALRIAILYTGNVLATAFAGLIAAGIFQMGGVGGLAGWRWLFIIQGAVTLVIAVISLWVLPDFPLTTKWLTEEERQLAHNRMEADTVENQGSTSMTRGLKQAAKDPAVWVFAAMAHMHLAANGFKNLLPTVVETLGFGQTITLVLTCPPYLIAGFITLFVSWSSGKYNERTWHITISKIVATIGFAASAATLNTAGRYTAVIIFVIGTYGVNSLILGWAGSVCGQTKEKKAAAIGIITGIMNASFIWTPYLWPKSDGPRYTTALVASGVFSMATAALAWFAKIMMKRRNARLREQEDDSGAFYVY